MDLLLLADEPDNIMLFAAAIVELLPGEEAADAAFAERAAARARQKALVAALRRERSRTPRGRPWSLDNWTNAQAASYTRFTKVRTVHIPPCRCSCKRPCTIERDRRVSAPLPLWWGGQGHVATALHAYPGGASLNYSPWCGCSPDGHVVP